MFLTAECRASGHLTRKSFRSFESLDAAIKFVKDEIYRKFAGTANPLICPMSPDKYETYFGLFFRIFEIFPDKPPKRFDDAATIMEITK